MPVYAHAYQTWNGKRRGALFRWMAIPKFAYREFLAKRAGVAVLTLSWALFVVWIGYIYLTLNTQLLELVQIPTRALQPVGPWLFKAHIYMQLPVCFLFAFLLGSGLIARDLKHGAVVLYMSKPINRWEYLLGKFSTLFLYCMLITWGQATLLFLLQTAAAAPHSEWRTHFWSEYARLPIAIFLYALCASGGISLMVLAASSLCKNAQYAGLIFAGYVIGASIVAAALVNNLHNRAWTLVSPLAVGGLLGAFFFEPQALENARIAEHWIWIASGAHAGLNGAILVWRVARAARLGR